MAVLIDSLLDKSGSPRHPEKAHRPDQPSPRKPDWIRVKAPVSPGYLDTQRIVRANGLHTVCEEAGCPNIGECWDKKHATFMIMGDTCTRACAFCNVKTGLPGALDAAEPEHVADATAKLGLAHIVITSVDRDDLADGGAAHFAAVIIAIRRRLSRRLMELSWDAAGTYAGNPRKRMIFSDSFDYHPPEPSWRISGTNTAARGIRSCSRP